MKRGLTNGDYVAFDPRARLLYPAYLFDAQRFTVGWIWDDSMAHDTFGRRLLGTLAFTLSFPQWAMKALSVPFGKEPGSVAEDLAVAPGDCVMIGDSEVDIATAKAAGVPGIAVSWGLRALDVLVAAKPDVLVHSAAELGALFGYNRDERGVPGD